MAKPLVFEKPLGMRDILPPSLAKLRHLEASLRQEIKQWGYDEIATPTLEYYDTVGQASVTTSDRMFKLLDKQGHTLVLRPDMTAPIARVVASLYREVPVPIRLFYQANVFRAQEQEAGRNAEFYQTGVELIGDQEVESDAEVIALAVACLQAAGVQDFKIAVGHVDFINGLLEEIVPDKSYHLQFRQFLYERDYVGYRQLVGKTSLRQEDKQRLLKLLSLRGGQAKIEAARQLTINGKAHKAVEAIASLWEALEAYGVTDHVLLDFNLIMDLDYYTGIVFEGYAADLGSPLVSGGSYDHLLKRFGREATATGFAVKMDRLMQVTQDRQAQGEPRLLIGYTADQRVAALREAQRQRQQGRVVITKLIKDEADLHSFQGRNYELLCLTDEEGSR